MSPRTRRTPKTSSPSESLKQKLKRHPGLESHFEAFVQIVENQDGSLEKADDAEGAILQEVRKLSGHSLTEWAQPQADRKAAEMPQLNPAASKDKKTVSWHSLFGEIEVLEQRFRHGRRGPSLRPFVVSAQVKNPGYSQRLERATVDFGADGAFARAPQKLKEHYGIEIPISAAQQITEKHGAEIVQFQSGNRKTEIPPAPGVACVIAELDGSLVPIVNTAEPSPEREKVDRRRTRQLEWQEARLAMAHEAGSVTPRFAATLGRVEEAGKPWLDCVLRAGAGTETFVHCVGDGAPWIFHPMELQFGTQARYLVDFSHLSEYLSAAADSCAADSKQVWLRNQQQRLKENHSDQVVDELAGFLEREKPLSGAMPVTACYRYLVNRPGQFDYQGALAAGLPIGSGEIESGHRYVIQARLKIAGAWWKQDNAEKMLALRVLRANQDWEHYWQNRNQKAA